MENQTIENGETMKKIASLKSFTGIIENNQRGEFIENPLFFDSGGGKKIDNDDDDDNEIQPKNRSLTCKKSDIYQYSFRFILFLLLPIIVLWLVIGNVDRLVFLTYIQIIYLVVIPSIVIKSFATKKMSSRIVKSMSILSMF